MEDEAVPPTTVVDTSADDSTFSAIDAAIFSSSKQAETVTRLSTENTENADKFRSTTPSPPPPPPVAPLEATDTNAQASSVESPSPVHAADNTTFLDRTEFEDGAKASDSFNDHFLNDSLPEAESSFVAPLSPIPTITKDGPDDTYLFDSPRKPSPQPTIQPQAVQLMPAHGAPGSALTAPAKSLPTGGSLSSVLPSLSSTSSTATGEQDSLLWASTDAPSQSHNTQGSNRGSDSVDSRRRSLNLNDSTGSGGSSTLRYGKRPRFLRSRNASQRSSASSFVTNHDAHDDVDSDVTVGLGADYALQSGGAISALGGGRQASDFLSRTVSMGSVASGISDTYGASGTSNDRLGVLSDHDTHRLNQNDLNATTADELLRTPRAKAAMASPTDTVLTRRVMDIQVPESLAREYRTKGGLVTPNRKTSDFTSTMVTAATNTTQRPGRNMTLKEQSSTIERLSKENFDLKLKVMFLSERLDKLSEDGVKEMIQENVEFRTNIAILQRDNKALRRRVKDLEKRIRDDEDDNARPGTSRSTNSSMEVADQDAEAQDREEEVIYLRERVEEYSTLVEQLRQDVFNKEAERRRMAEVVKSLQTTTEKHAGENLGRQEEEAVWKDLLEQETARREQADEDNRRLRDEIFRMKQELHGTGVTGANSGISGVGNAGTAGTLHHTTNIYNITKRAPVGGSSSGHGSRGLGSGGGSMDQQDGSSMYGSSTMTAGTSTLIEELRREGEQLRHENAELRKEVGAQTSMLTSRNREKERLYQEIEDLKMAQRRGGGPAPSTIDSLLDRSASQIGARERAGSRASGGTRAETVVVATDDQEREDLENRNASLRDKINEAKLENQTLLQELEAALQQRQETEEIALGVQKDYEGAMADLMAMQTERDELIAELNDLEQRHVGLQGEFEDLRVEAQEAIDGYEEDADVRDEEAQKLQAELSEKTENFQALQEEMRKLSEALVGLEDETENKVRRVQQLEQELGEANKELEELEGKLIEANDKSQRLLVQQESSQGEIAFLREEQEGDKLNISRLEVSVTKMEEHLREEQERVRQLQQQIVQERERSESLATKDKKEMQHVVNELSREASLAKEEARKLRKSLSSREVEATEWKERLQELENNLREALGDLSGTRSSLLKSIAKMQRELEDTTRQLDATKGALMDKERIIKQRDALLESHGLEARKVAEALDKERVAHRNTKHQFETFQKTHQHVTRTVSTQDARINELESSKTLDKRRMSQLESTFRDQLTERNHLLLLLWTRLSAVCGTDWAHDNSLINGRALPSLEVVATMLPGFSRNLLAAIKHIEAVVGGFPARIKGVERDLWREYQTLESTLDSRVKRLDRLESLVRSSFAASSAGPGGSVVGVLGSATAGAVSGQLSTSPDQRRLVRLEEAYRQLKVENTTLRSASDARARARAAAGDGAAMYTSAVDATAVLDDPLLSGGSPSPSIPTGPRDRSSKSPAVLRAKSSGRSSVPRPVTATRPMTAGELALQDTGIGAENGGNGSDNNSNGHTDQRWIIRLRDLENKLKLEREGRTMDRNEAVRRLREQEAELLRRSEREKRQRET